MCSLPYRYFLNATFLSRCLNLFSFGLVDHHGRCNPRNFEHFLQVRRIPDHPGPNCASITCHILVAFLRLPVQQQKLISFGRLSIVHHLFTSRCKCLLILAAKLPILSIILYRKGINLRSLIGMIGTHLQRDAPRWCTSHFTYFCNKNYLVFQRE